MTTCPTCGHELSHVRGAVTYCEPCDIAFTTTPPPEPTTPPASWSPPIDSADRREREEA